MTETELDVLRTTALTPESTPTELRRAALVVCGELSMTRQDLKHSRQKYDDLLEDWARLKENVARPIEVRAAA